MIRLLLATGSITGLGGLLKADLAVAQPVNATAQNGTRPQPLEQPSAASATAASSEPGQTSSLPQALAHELAGPTRKPNWKDRADADRAEARGKALVRKGDCAAALEHFEKAYSLAGRDSALTAAAECHESSGNVVIAHDLVAQLNRVHVPKEIARRKQRENWLSRLQAESLELEVVSSEPGARIEVDSTAWFEPDGDAPARAIRRIPKGEHKILVTKAGFETFSTALTLDGGASKRVEATLVKIKPKPKPIDVAQMITAPVTDFCRIKLGMDKARYQKQRLVTFDLAGTDITNAPEPEVDDKGNVIDTHHVFERSQMHDHLRASLFKTFPMPRFFNVKSTAESPANLRGKTFVPGSEMIKASEIDSFAAYSIACADWVALPRVTAKSAQWKKVEKERLNAQGKKEKYRAWTFSVTLSAEMDIYRREGDGWRLLATVTGDNGGLLGLAFGLAASAQQGSGKKQLPNLSDRPDASCSVPFVGTLSEVGKNLQMCQASTLELDRAISGARAVVKLPDMTLTDGSAQPSGMTTSGGAQGAGGATSVAQATAGRNSTLDAAAGTSAGVAGVGGSTLEVSAAGAAGAGSVGEKVPSDSSRSSATNAESSGPASAIGVALRDYRGSISPSSLAAIRGARDVAGLEPAIAAANRTYDSCSSAVGAIASAEKELRQLASADLAGLGVEAVLGFSACAGIGVSVDLGAATAPGTSELRSDFCKNVQDDVSLGAPAMSSISVCATRTAMEQTSLVLQKEAKLLEGWKLFAPLQEVPGGTPKGVFGVSMGKEEGADRGDLYLAIEQPPDGRRERLGWGRIMRQGPGGERGEKDPSLFKFRVGRAPFGTRMEERAQIGVLMALRPQFGLFVSRGSLATSVPLGAAIEGGYNASAFVPFADEVWSRVYFSFETGQKSEKFISADLVPEVVYYVADHWAIFTGAGPGYVRVTKDPTASPGAGTGSDSSSKSNSGGNVGLAVIGGADYSIAPDWYARGSLWYRQGLSGAKLTDGTDMGSLSGLRLGVQAGYIF